MKIQVHGLAIMLQKPHCLAQVIEHQAGFYIYPAYLYILPAAMPQVGI